MSDQKTFIPTAPQNLVLRPLTKGIRLDLPAQLLEPGSLIEAQNFFVTLDGLKRRPPLAQFLSGATVDFDPIVDLGVVWTTAGTQKTIVFDKRFIYEVGPSGLTGVYSTYTTGTIATSGTTVTGTSTLWDTAASDVAAGDVMVLDANGSGDGPEAIVISSITSDTELELASTPDGTYGAGTDYAIRRRINPDSDYRMDWTALSNVQSSSRVIIADYTRKLQAYDPSGPSIGDLGSDDIIPACVTFWADRLWCGNTKEDSGAKFYRQRVRWTNTSDLTDFSTSTNGTGFLDLPYTQGGLRRMLPLGNLLVLYFDDAVFIGRKTNNPDLPIRIDQIDTGAVGLVSTKGVTSWRESHFFIAQDNIYVLRANGLRAIGDPIVQDSIQRCDDLEKTYVAHDPANDRIAFGFPRSGTSIEEIYTFDYLTGSWSHESINTTMLATRNVNLNITWDTLPTVLDTNTWDASSANFPTWNSMQNQVVEKDLFYASERQLLVMTTAGSTDVLEGTPIPVVIETGDLDLGRPDHSKTATRLSLKLAEILGGDTALTFTVTGSVDRGNSWKSLGTLSIATTADEDAIRFKLRGSLIRFRLTSSSDVEPYVVSEIVVRGRPGGLETLR